QGTHRGRAGRVSGIGAEFAQTVLSGPLLLAAGAAALAGLVSFASPCVLPLVPGYVGYVTGLSGSSLRDNRPGGSCWASACSCSDSPSSSSCWEPASPRWGLCSPNGSR